MKALNFPIYKPYYLVTTLYIHVHKGSFLMLKKSPSPRTLLMIVMIMMMSPSKRGGTVFFTFFPVDPAAFVEGIIATRKPKKLPVCFAV